MGNSPYPPWIPTPVVEYVESALREPHDHRSLERLRRLITSPDLRNAWRALSKITAEPDLLVAFARNAAFSLWLSQGQHLLPRASPATQRRQFHKVAQASQALLKHLEALGEGQAELGVQKLASAAHRATLDAFGKRRNDQLPRLATLAFLTTTEAIPQLRTLHEVAHVAANAPTSPGLRKLRAVNAVRTAYVHELARFIQQHFNKPFFAVVATMANVMFDEFDKPLTADHVRNLISPPKKISGIKLK